MLDDDRAADARAAELLGYTEVTWFDDETMWARNAHGWRAVARPGISPVIARQLVAAVPVERRARFVNALYGKVGAWELGRIDAAYALILATPAQLRDAVLEAMEER